MKISPDQIAAKAREVYPEPAHHGYRIGYVKGYSDCQQELQQENEQLREEIERLKNRKMFY